MADADDQTTHNTTAPSGGEQGDPTLTPFRAHRIDPWQTPEAITEAMRELAEEADEEERRRLQGVWRELTLKREDQLRAAFFAHAHPATTLPDVESMDASQLTRRFRLGARPGDVLPSALTEHRPTVADLVVLPPLMLSGARQREDAAWTDVAPEDDVLLRL